jgi:uncharacterized protein YozE (UPF0346 family)
MKIKNIIFIILIISLILACDKQVKREEIETISLRYNEQLFQKELVISEDINVPLLQEWAFVDSTNSSKIVNSMFYDEDWSDVEVLQNMEMKSLVIFGVSELKDLEAKLKLLNSDAWKDNISSKAVFQNEGNTFYQFMIKTNQYINLKAIIELNKGKYIDVNFIVPEQNYSQVAKFIETTLAYISNKN